MALKAALADGGSARIFRRWKLVCGLAAIFACSGCVMVPPLVDAGREAKVERDVVFTPAGWPKVLRADVYRPAAKGPRPAVLLLHGGGVTGGGSRWQMNAIAGKLVRRGYVVVNAEYRFIPAYRYPAPSEDVREALKWMRKNSAAYGIDPNRLATFGYSAGGYLAALGALNPGAGNPPLRAVVTGGAPFDLVFFARGDLMPTYLGGSFEAMPDLYREASPVNHVRRSSPPIFMYQGSKDRLVRPEHALRMQQVCEEEGARYELRWLKSGHIATFLFSGPVVDESIDFLDREMK